MLKVTPLLQVAVLLGSLIAIPAAAAKPSPNNPVLGNDVSYPQCNKPLPNNPAFGIVGVNSGLANSTNPCLQTQLAWAQKSTGGTGQPKAAVYVNTGNPGDVLAQYQVQDWPSSSVAADPYGQCSGTYTDNMACSWEYGYERAQADASNRGVANPSTYQWWLDVETYNSWTSRPDNNTATLEGMTYYFQSVLGSRVGLYSTAVQWAEITGGAVGLTSNLGGLDSWLPGATSAAMATSYCNLAPLTLGGHVTLTQYSTHSDYDVSCI
jgi:hypothetical protein